MEVTIGGERLGAGKKEKVWLHNYERSTHDIGYVWRSTMASGTLVPFMSELALPGDTFDINLNADCLTHPTIGPLFGSYKIQLDVFQIPVRLYQGALHMNLLNIGRDMSKIELPQMQVRARKIDPADNLDSQQVNPSCLLSYLGVRGVGYRNDGLQTAVARRFSSIPLLAYWDIYKNYYANKQEEIGVVIHKEPALPPIAVTDCDVYATFPGWSTPLNVVIYPTTPVYGYIAYVEGDKFMIKVSGDSDLFDINATMIDVADDFNGSNGNWIPLNQFVKDVIKYPGYVDVILGIPKNTLSGKYVGAIKYTNSLLTNNDSPPTLVNFPLENIDTVRTQILRWDPANGAYTLSYNSLSPYGLMFKGAVVEGIDRFCTEFNQEGLAIKTYQSDLFNNWISTEWIDGADGISELTKVDTSSGSFTIDELNLNKKIYDMLNRIAISGGTYDDWLDAVYTHERTRSAENPMYIGGLIKNLVFQEVVSTAAVADNPLGTLAGRGRMGDKHKGGNIIAKIDEPSYIMGIVSITPHIDYSQGNKWDMNLRTMNDFHKPALDAIGFQDLITDQMAYWDTAVDEVTEWPIYKSAGKQPAWINYMTNVNQVRGNFADQTQQMWMTLNRRYELGEGTTPTIKDLTTYIDPMKFNHIFADTRIDAQNFWMQIGVNITARRKMSAKVMPNL